MFCGLSVLQHSQILGSSSSGSHCLLGEGGLPTPCQPAQHGDLPALPGQVACFLLLPWWLHCCPAFAKHASISVFVNKIDPVA